MSETPGTPAAELREYLEHVWPSFAGRHEDVWTFEARLDWQRTLNEGGWVALGWPEEAGGRGLDIADRVACDAVLAGFGAPTIAGVMGVQNMGPTLIAYGSVEQKTHLPKLLSGEEVWVQGFSEPDAGSDLAALQTRARIDGGEFVVDGQKVWTSDGIHGTHCELLVRTDPSAPKHKGISCLMVPLDVPGVDVRPLRQMTGETDFCEIFFDGARFPLSTLCGPLNEGWRVAITTLAHERTGVISLAGQLEREVLDLAHRIPDDLAPALRDQLVERYVEGRVLGMLGKRSLARLSSGGEPGPEHSVIKFAWSQINQRVAETDFLIAGTPALAGLEPEVSYRFLRRRASTIAAGTTEIMRNILAERVLGLPK